MRLLAFILMLFAVGAQAASPTFQQFNTDQFGTTGNRIIIKPGSLQTNNIIYGDVAVGQLTVPALFNIYGTNRFWDTSGATSAKLWFEDPYFVFDQSISVPGINLNGDFRTTWPSGSGGGSPFTNIVVKSADNNPSPDQGPSMIIRPQEVSSNPGLYYVATEWLPTYTNNSFRGLYRHYIGAVTNTLGDLAPDIIWNINYNGGGNSAGVSSFGPTDTNEPVWIEQKESRWQNLGSLSQLEWWDYFATPYTAFGTNFGMRWWTGTLIWGTTNKNYVRAEAKATVSTLEIQNPTATNGLAGVLFAADNAQQQSYTLTIDGGIVIRTNEAGNGSLLMKGGFLSARAPDSVSSLGGVNIEADWNNSDSLKPHGLVYNSGSEKALYLGKPGDSSKTFTNVVVASNFVALGFATFPRGISANSNNFVKMPTNAPTDGYAITATGTAGDTAWEPGGGGSGDTNALSYVNGADPQYAAVSIEAMHRLNLWFTNNFRALAVINSGGNSEVAVYGNAAGAQIASFQDSGGFIGSGAWELRAGSDGDAHISFTDSGTTIYDNEENPIFDFSNIGVPYVEQIAGTYADFKGHTVHTNGTLAISPLLGTVAADNAPAGTYGEYVESKIAVGSAVSLTTATTANITSISLTAGDWDVEGKVTLTAGSATFTAGSSGITTTTATVPTDGSESYCGNQTVTTSFIESMTIDRKRINVSATTTVYLVGRATFSAGTVGGFGQITARRIR